MALGDSYITLNELKGYLKIPTSDTADDTQLDDARMVASREVEKYCGRQFNKTTSASARVYGAGAYWRVDVDDFHTTTDLAIKTDSADDGTYEGSAWASTDYRLEPANGVVDGETGWPYSRILTRSAGAQLFVLGSVAVQVTAQWGWTAVPAAVKQATFIVAAKTFRMAGAPFGVAGFGEAGLIRVRDIPEVATLLDPYRRYPVKVG